MYQTYWSLYKRYKNEVQISYSKCTLMRHTWINKGKSVHLNTSLIFTQVVEDTLIRCTKLTKILMHDHALESNITSFAGPIQTIYTNVSSILINLRRTNLHWIEYTVVYTQTVYGVYCTALVRTSLANIISFTTEVYPCSARNILYNTICTLLHLNWAFW